MNADEPRGVAGAITRMLAATNSHDLDALVACFTDDYVNETPAHPQRSFTGSDQVRRNWSQIFAGVPDVESKILRLTVDGETAWTELELRGTRRDGSALLMRGVGVFTGSGDRLARVRFYLEPVEQDSGDADAAIAHAVVPADVPDARAATPEEGAS
jgi:ketosteroid isomerase-like protein